MKKQLCRISLPLLAIAATTLLGSCNVFDQVPNYRIVEPDVVVPKNFLYNPDKTYNEWLNTPLRVNYHEVSVETVFASAPFEGFRYELHEIPADMRPVTLNVLGQTRKQLLWAISHDNNLKMILHTTAGGRPQVVEIRWRGDGSTSRRGAIE